MTKITDLIIHDLRFPTSDLLDGSDAMNPDPDYSSAYVIIKTDGVHTGFGHTFTIGRGNEIVIAALKALRSRIVGLEVEWMAEDMGRFWSHVTADSQLRWIGPDKGAIHLATAAIVNGAWDLLAKIANKPVWRLIGEMSPEQIVKLVDFRYITDVITPDEALTLLKKAEQGKAERIKNLQQEGYLCYTTSAGWLGYSDEKLRRLCREARDAGFTHTKFKIGHDLEDDIRRLKIARQELGEDMEILIDANQVWEVNEAIDWVKALAFARPYFIEEPTSPDDIAGHKTIREAIKPVKVATGEMCQNRIMFKQFIAGDALDIVQLDVCRLGGLNEAIAVMLMAAKYDLPVWPHGGGIGLCEYVQHVSMIDYIAISAEKDSKRIEYVDHLHQHFFDPCIVKNGAYQAPTIPGFSIEMKPETIRDFAFKG